MSLQIICSFNEQLKTQAYHILHQKEAGLEKGHLALSPDVVLEGQVFGQEECHHPPDRLSNEVPPMSATMAT